MADETSDSLALGPVDLGSLAREVVLRMLPRADHAGVDLGAHGLEHVVIVPADAALIEGMLTNLIDNALRHGRHPDGRVTVVTVELQASGDEAALTVEDNGPGVSAREQTSLLQRWAQGSTGTRLGEGAGLGLAIVGRYAELLRALFELSPAARGGLRATLIFKRENRR